MNQKSKVSKNFSKTLKENKIGIFIIAKLGSKRLKDKIKTKLNGITLIEILIKRIIKEIGSKNLIICSSGTGSKRFFQTLRKKYQLKIFFGQNKNVLGRILKCMRKYNFKHFVRVTGDNPFTDCKTIKDLVRAHIKNNNDYTYTMSMPIGMRSEVFSLKALVKCEKSILNRNSTEYLTYFFLRRDLYKIENIKIRKLFNLQNQLNISIDYENDLFLLKKILNKFNGNIYVDRQKIIKFLKENTQPIRLIKKVSIKTNLYDARYIFDKKNKIISLN